ncbi:MAG: ABC transporter ATP-binding protein [Planctomycetes bacterium]|nr:ABC transporter ATP-binding protein [Planctomycetota bacterium]
MVGGSEKIVQTFAVTKIFRDFWHREKVAAVRELNLEIFPNEVFGLLGPNGSGKSTTIKMILGLLYPTRGYIRVLGKRPTNVGIKARIGFLPEESHLYPFLNAWETLDYYGRLLRQGRRLRRERAEMLLEMVGLTNVAYRRVGEYSKGMQRRIGLAQALINDPDLLILDEPTSGLDPLGTRQFKDLIEQLSRRGKTIILCSHLLADMEDICDRVGILYGGRLRAIGDVSDLLSRGELTQITAERLNQTTVEKIRRLIAEEECKTVLDVSSPLERLEDLFLRVVAEAKSDLVSTGGAVPTGSVAEFLRAGGDDGQGQAVVEQLVAAAEQEQVGRSGPAADQSGPEEAPVKINAGVLDDLTAADDAEPSADLAAGLPADEPAQQADLNVIESLLDDAQTKGYAEDA